jgi:hypothetical protein
MTGLGGGGDGADTRCGTHRLAASAALVRVDQMTPTQCAPSANRAPHCSNPQAPLTPVRLTSMLSVCSGGKRQTNAAEYNLASVPKRSFDEVKGHQDSHHGHQHNCRNLHRPHTTTHKTGSTGKQRHKSAPYHATAAAAGRILAVGAATHKHSAGCTVHPDLQLAYSGPVGAVDARVSRHGPKAAHVPIVIQPSAPAGPQHTAKTPTHGVTTTASTDHDRGYQCRPSWKAVGGEGDRGSPCKSRSTAGKQGPRQRGTYPKAFNTLGLRSPENAASRVFTAGRYVTDANHVSLRCTWAWRSGCRRHLTHRRPVGSNTVGCARAVKGRDRQGPHSHPPPTHPPTHPPPHSSSALARARPVTRSRVAHLSRCREAARSRQASRGRVPTTANLRYCRGEQPQRQGKAHPPAAHLGASTAMSLTMLAAQRVQTSTEATV